MSYRTTLEKCVWTGKHLDTRGWTNEAPRKRAIKIRQITWRRRWKAWRIGERKASVKTFPTAGVINSRDLIISDARPLKITRACGLLGWKRRRSPLTFLAGRWRGGRNIVHYKCVCVRFSRYTRISPACARCRPILMTAAASPWPCSRYPSLYWIFLLRQQRHLIIQ